eukprot:CAMPEP_0174237716 /NCGR_PEP_ID=MMETSP0417-20130205/9308_1 /TAXON_ID=242541 /ORGANISM="Mayorella sp, Strain BSH-02190019" /LENGTH=210 /DNA_ID=CAMNT_0015316501 /DNA_START=166 /DNA_END=795 /DNA_ORIENTATION=-
MKEEQAKAKAAAAAASEAEAGSGSAAASTSSSSDGSSSSSSKKKKETPETASAAAAAPVKSRRQNAAELRVQKDVGEMDECPDVRVEFPDANNLMEFKLFLSPQDGLYAGGTYEFTVRVPANYPFEPPKVHCDTLIYHPNIDFEGHVCLNILRQDWMPVLNLKHVLFGLLVLFSEPNPDDPLNKDAASLMVSKPAEFQRNVRSSLRGGYV